MNKSHMTSKTHNRHLVHSPSPVSYGVSIISIFEKTNHGVMGPNLYYSWWHHQMETFSMLRAICAWFSSVAGEFPAQKPVMQGFDVFFDLRLNKRLSKQWWGWWFETPSRSLWCHCNFEILWGWTSFELSILMTYPCTCVRHSMEVLVA